MFKIILFKGLLHPKTKMLSFLTYPCVVSKPAKASFFFVTQFKIFWMRTGRLDCPFHCQVINTVKAQKSMKDIIKIVHLPSVVQYEFYEATRILFMRKENKNNDFIQQFVSPASP